ncbi:MAG: protein-L-isoaspartate O-methyltransferase, partial [Pseudorhodoplanes sp.]
AAHVVSIERYRTLAEKARKTFDRIGYTNIDVILGDGFEGAPNLAPFDRIIVTAAAEAVPDALTGQLADDGIMVLPLGPRNGPQQIVRLRNTPAGLEREDLIAVRFVPLLPGRAKEL